MLYFLLFIRYLDGICYIYNLLSLVTVGNSYECSDALVCTVIGSWKSNLIGSGDWSISIQFVSEGRSKVVAEREQACSLGFGFVLLLLLFYYCGRCHF